MWRAPEEKYSASADSTHRKRYGQYFTPPNLASLMADWIAGCQPKLVLDPAMGTGILTRAAAERCPSVSIVAYEKDANILAFADVPECTQVRHANYLTSDYDVYDAAILNPPYIRHREMEGYEDARGQISVRSGYVVPRSANLYVYFTIRAALQLRPGGRASVLIPTEWMNANFSASFKRFLLESKTLREVVLFSGCSNIFDDALTTASILFLERAR